MRDVRLSQASNEKSTKGPTFQSLFNQMVRSYRQMVAAGPIRTLPSPQEQALLDKQQHYDFSELSQPEQMRLKGELDSMWEQIPAHLQQKARDLAGVN